MFIMKGVWPKYERRGEASLLQGREVIGGVTTFPKTREPLYGYAYTKGNGVLWQVGFFSLWLIGPRDVSAPPTVTMAAASCTPFDSASSPLPQRGHFSPVGFETVPSRFVLTW
jgi:hypothetical protein